MPCYSTSTPGVCRCAGSFVDPAEPPPVLPTYLVPTLQAILMRSLTPEARLTCVGVPSTLKILVIWSSSPLP